MRNSFVALIAVVLLVAFSSVAFAQGGGTGAARPAAPSTPPANPKDLSGLWNGVQPNNAFMMEKDMSYTPKGKAFYDNQQPRTSNPPVDGPEENDPIFKCEPSSVPRNYFNTHTIEIEHTPNKVIQLFEAWRNFRIFYIDGKMPSHPEGTWYGDSIARWDGNTLVVDTANFNGRAWIDQYGHPTSDKMKLTERFTRTAQDRLEDVITITDPVNYSKPWGGTKRYALRNDWIIEDYLCSPAEVNTLDTDVTNKAHAGDPLGVKGGKK
jgi:hypothetical protein